MSFSYFINAFTFSGAFSFIDDSVMQREEADRISFSKKLYRPLTLKHVVTQFLGTDMKPSK